MSEVDEPREFMDLRVKCLFWDGKEISIVPVKLMMNKAKKLDAYCVNSP